MKVLKILFWSGLIFLFQILVFLAFQFGPFDRNDYENVYFLFVRCFLVAFVLAYVFFIWRLKSQKLWEYLLLGTAPVVYAVYIIISPDTIKIRGMDGLFFLAFILIYYAIKNKTNPVKMSVAVLYSIFIFLVYKPLTNYIFYTHITNGKNVSSNNDYGSFYALYKNGKVNNPFNLRNKTVLVNVWNRSCGICIKKMPKMKELQDYFSGDTNVVIVSLYGALGDEDSVEWFYKEYRSSKEFDSLGVNLAFANRKAFTGLDIRLFPQYFIISSTGEIRRYNDLSFDRNAKYSVYEKISALSKNQDFSF